MLDSNKQEGIISAGIYSINYERIFVNNFTARLGVSYLPEIDLGSYVTIGPEFSTPLSLNYLHYIDDNLNLEMGGGFTFKFTEKGSGIT